MFKLLGADLLLIPILRQMADFVKTLTAILLNFVAATGAGIFRRNEDLMRKVLVFARI